jgi:hypothetical protein
MDIGFMDGDRKSKTKEKGENIGFCWDKIVYFFTMHRFKPLTNKGLKVFLKKLVDKKKSLLS